LYPSPAGLDRNDNTFTVGAAGQIDNDPTIDEWTMTDQRQLTNLTDDVVN
jgi:hypothetical protein